MPTVHPKTSIRAFSCTNKLTNLIHYKLAENVFEEPVIAIFARIKPIKNNVAFVNNPQKAYKSKLNFVFNDTLKAVPRTDFPQILRHIRRNTLTGRYQGRISRKFFVTQGGTVTARVTPLELLERRMIRQRPARSVLWHVEFPCDKFAKPLSLVPNERNGNKRTNGNSREYFCRKGATQFHTRAGPLHFSQK